MRVIISRYKRPACALAAFILLLVGLIIRHNLINSVSTQKPWERWSADGKKYGYAAAYFPDKEGFSLDSLQGYRSSLDRALTEASVEVGKDSRGYIDAYSAYGTAEIQGDRTNLATTVNVTAVGGDYYFMHPSRLLSGSFLSDDDLMKDRVVIDENAAWFLYGSSNIAGKRLTIGGKRFYIAGVVESPESGAAKKTYGARNRIYMSYEAFSGLSPEAAITCYEIIYPDMITNYAYNTLRSTLGLNDESSGINDGSASGNDSIDVVNMNTRFRISKIWNVACSYGERSAHTDGIIYPFWENECRRIEDMLVIELIFRIISIILIIILVIPYLIRGLGYCKYRVKITSEYIISKIRR